MIELLVEFLGTMFFVFIVFLTKNDLAIGAAITIAIILGEKFSGAALFNPVVAIVFYAAGKLDETKVIPYIIVEIFGAFAGFYLWKTIK